MAKFKVLEHNQRFLSTKLRIDVDGKRETHLKSPDRFFTSTPVLLIAFVLFSVLTSAAVKMSVQSNNFKVRLAAALVAIATFQAITIFLNMSSNMQKIVELYQTLQSIVDNAGMRFSLIVNH